MKPPESEADFTNKIFSLAHGFRLQKGGVIGRLCYVAITILLVGALVVWSLPETQRIWMLLGLAVLILIVVMLIFRYGSNHPHIAILEGAEIIRREELIIAAKGQTPIPASLVEDEEVADPYPPQSKLLNNKDGEEL